MKKPLIIIAAVIVLLLIVALALPFFIDANQFKPTLETDISKALGREVQIGNIQLAIFSGGVTIDNVSIADDPAFSHSPFLTAKQLTVGVSLFPLIFSKKLEVRSFTVVEPEVSLLRSPSGVWNFSSLGGGAGKPASKAAADAPAPSSATSLTVGNLSISNGRISVGKAGAHANPHVYENVNLDATDLSYTTPFPFHLAAKTPGGGEVKLDGKAGPIDASDASLTPLNATVDVQHLDIAATGFVDPSTAIAGVIGFHGDLASDGHQMTSKGTVQAEKIKLVASGSPSRVPINVDYDANYDLKRQAGDLKQGDVHIGKAVAHLTGDFDTAGTETTVKMKLNGQGMSVPDLEGVLPAVGVTLPTGASLQSGTLDANLAISGPVDKLTITGPINLSNGKLAGFNLSSKLGALASFTGLGSKPGSDTEIQTLSTDLHMDPSGTHVQNLNVVVPSIGTITGDGNISSTGQLDCKMVAKLSGVAGAMASPLTALAGGGKSQGGGIPFKIEGTTTNPVFIPDVAGMAGNMAKGGVAAPTNAANAAAGVIGGLLGKKKKQQ